MPYILKIGLIQAAVITATMWVGIRFGIGRGRQRGYSEGYRKCLTDHFYRSVEQTSEQQETTVSS